MPDRDRPPGRRLARRTPLTASPRRRTTTRRRSQGTDSDRQAARDRDRGRCVRCGAPARDLDHVLGRGMGGTSGPRAEQISGVAWLRTLCGHGNTRGCHAWKENNRDAARRLGYRLDRNGIHRDASQVPVWTWRGWVRFTDDGHVEHVQGLRPPPPDLARIP